LDILDYIDEKGVVASERMLGMIQQNEARHQGISISQIDSEEIEEVQEEGRII
jgi:hypothetical protein